MTRYLGAPSLSAATFILQLALLHGEDVQQVYHFAFMAVSLALLGFGASGSLLSVWGRRLSPLPLCLGFGNHHRRRLPRYQPPAFRFILHRLGPQAALLPSALLFSCGRAFLFGGLLVGGELMGTGERGKSHLVYGANLIGSALGSLGALSALEAFGGVGTVILAALLGVASGLLFLDVRALRWPQGVAAALLPVGLIVIGVGVLLRPPELFAQRLSPYKTLPTCPLKVHPVRLPG